MANPFTTTKRSYQKTTARRKQPTRSAKSTKSAPKQAIQFKPLSAERKLDIAGVVIVLLGVLTFISMVSNKQSSFTAPIVSFLNNMAGYGAFLLPIALVGVGLWMVLRRVESLPYYSGERLAGLLLLLLNLFTLVYMLGGQFSGGWLGMLLGRPMLSGLGGLGSAVVLIAWFVIALAMLLDVAIPDLFRKLSPFATWLRGVVAGQFSKIKQAPRRTSAARGGHIPIEEDEGSHELPPDFQPFVANHAVPKPQPAAVNAAAPFLPDDALPPAPSLVAPASGAQSVVALQTAALVTQSIPEWMLPSIETILDPASPSFIQSGVDQERAKIIEDTLRSFGAPAHVVEIQRGPTITQFGVEPEFVESRQGKTRVRVSAIARLVDDLALALAAPRIRIQAPVPGRSYVGIEVPNVEISLVALREVMESDAFRKGKSKLKISLGKDVAGKPIVSDLTDMPHLLIAGTTGSGKSVCVNSILSCLLLNNTPADLRLVLVDPKRVELTGYNGIPHLLAPVVVDTERVVGALQWILREMDSRYHKFAQAGARNIKDYNARGGEHLPYLVIVIDELADLMLLAPEETERCITRLAQLARATGIHVVIATQRPSVDVVTGLIKANFPARIAFAVASNTDSRVILDQPGAERLLGRGDMLFQAPDAPAPVRLQGTFVSDQEIQRLTEAWRLQAINQSAGRVAGQPQSDSSLPVGVPLVQAPLWDAAAVPPSNADPLLQEAIALVRREGRASISMLQRRMRIGYTRAARLVDAMEEQEIIGPTQANSQVRPVLDYGQGAPPKEE
ncbi:MAG: DNA translocase FtsK 4TM domain-containing protein [Anaerolineaceae bacterium]